MYDAVHRIAGRIVAAACLLSCAAPALADSTPQTLPFEQDWSDTGLITTSDDWSGVPGIVGHRGDGLVGGTGADPQTIVADGTGTPVDVNANQTNPNGFTTGGVAEFELANPTAALAGSGTAKAPFLLIALDTLGQTGIRVQYTLRDLESGGDNAAQAVALQYRVGNSGDFTNVPAGFVADATQGPNVAGPDIPVDATLPAAADNQALVQVRIITADAAGADEHVGIDDIAISAGGGDPTLSIADASANEGNAGTTALDFIVTLSQPAPTGGIVFTATTADGSAQAPGDYAALAAAPFAVAEGETSAVVTVQVVGDTQAEPDETFTVTIATSAPGVVLGDANATGTIVNDDVAIVEIFQIQGTGLRSPFAPASGNDLGLMVTSEDNVVTAIAASGFFMQTPDARDDGDALTSNGIFVFTGSAPAVAVGDLVDVTGRVQEFFNWTQIAGTPSVTVIAGSQPLPTAVAWDESTPSMDPDALSCDQTNFECFENMRVGIAAGALITGNQTFGSDPYAEVFATASGLRARREAGLIPGVPDIAGVPRWDGNPEVFELDADALGTVPNPTALTGGTLFAAEGVIAYEFGQHEFWPTSWTPVPATLPRPVPASGGDAELRVASFNVLNLCDAGCGDPAPTPPEFALKVQRLSDYVGNTLRLPDVLGVQEIENQTSLDALAARLNADFAGAGYVAHVGVSNDPRGIRNGFLVRASRVAVVRIRDLDETVTITQCSGTPPCPLHDRPPLLLEATFAGGDGERFAVMNNHTRSLSGIHDAGANGQRVRFKRFEQGKSIANLVQRFQLGEELEPATPAGGIDTTLVPLVLVGDYNAFEVTDGYVDLVGLAAGTYVDDDNEFKLNGPNIVDPPLASLVLDIDIDDRYSYTFRENWGNIQGQEPRTVSSVQVLDHGLINVNATRWCGGLVYGRSNADAPAREETVGTTGVAVSDHDGFVIRLFTDRLFAHDFEQAGRCMR